MKTLPFLLFFACSSGLFAQSDILFYENFSIDKTASWQPFPSGDDQTWVNFDEDGLPPNDPSLDTLPAWYPEIFSFPAQGIEDTVITSFSWLAGDKPGNRNWLILPPIFLPDSQPTLRWRSAPFEGPGYQDGYEVLLSPLSNFDFDFTDTLFSQAQMVKALNANSSKPMDYEFSPGWLHANSYQDSMYFEPQKNGNQWTNLCFLEPHTVSLQKFAGQTVYIAFLHDSDNDHLIRIDDILIEKNHPLASENPLENELKLLVFPNPTSSFVDVIFRLNHSESLSYQLLSAAGQVVFGSTSARFAAGENSLRLDLRRLVTGPYFLEMTIGEEKIRRQILRN